MPMTPEQIFQNFRAGTSEPLQGASDELRKMVMAYRGLSASFAVMRNQMSSGWTGEAAASASDRADPLWTAVSDSAELLEACARAHDAQTAAFGTARDAVVDVPPTPEKPNVLELLKEIVEHGPAAPFERMADYREAAQAHHEAAQHNLAVYDEYYWTTTDNQNIPAEYPNPVLGSDNTVDATTTEFDGMTAVEGVDTMTAVSEGGGEGGGPAPGTGSGGGSLSGGGLPAGAGLGPPGGGSGLSGPGSVNLSSLTDDPSLPDPSHPDQTSPSRVGTPVGPSTPSPSTPDPTSSPPPRNPAVLSPIGIGTPPGSLSPGSRESSRNQGIAGEQAGVTHAARAAGGSDMSPLGLPLGGVGDRAGGDQFASGSQAGRGAGGPGGGQAAPGSIGGGRGSGHGGFGMMPPGSANREEDKEHTRPEYLIEPDPEEIFGSDQSASSPVIGASWKPEQ